MFGMVRRICGASIFLIAGGLNWSSIEAHHFSGGLFTLGVGLVALGAIVYG